ncbi:Dolichyl-diphosphooligosaccharide--protein glycosyltransferase subunit 1 [Wickerhamiella sorbophila]|uniref:Dolichyl-diphosphooligosaccharide--protein glycosyltransferase subunit 1 n=1 Tax=Wickerhamiella sorbophila TaxID=45607 RepID=A0A2T0FEZ2_9ASCO|nr:Dolichyl-diphosphooligosaccharide--protein glycosyltransferase subunit 1 [Wickerhamiella sorbophila]PRT53545.1 Dolichyl-diphosphooligosaccharide--protein glycosyltransferase subunit 1 [Wickerhamiella sorbophila]
MLSFVAGFAVLSAVLGASSPESAVPDVFRNIELQQVIDLTAAYTRESLKVVAMNIGEEPVREYFLPLTYEDASKLAALEAEDDVGSLRINEVDSLHDGSNAYFSVNLRQPVAPGEEIEFTVGRAFIAKTQPYPRKAEQSEQQLLVYNGSRTILSPYKSQKQTLTIKTVTQNIYDVEKDNRQTAKSQQLGGLATFGPFNNVKPFTRTPLTLQYENPLPQVHFPRLDRKIWISHWGDAISFDESYDLQNVGTELKGSFSRLDYMRTSDGRAFSLNTAAVRQLMLSVPSPARDMYYVDLVGNVSTSRVQTSAEGTRLEIHPRYPVVGGWHYNFTVGWTNPLGQFVHKVGPNRYTAAIPLLTGPEDASYDEVSTKIILPEGATNIDFADVYGNSAEVSTVYSYLDFQGRPALDVVHRKLVTDHRAGLLLVSYDYSLLAALRKPLILATAVFCVFVTAFYGSQINWSL